MAELIGKVHDIIEADSYNRALLVDGKLKRRLNVSIMTCKHHGYMCSKGYDVKHYCIIP